MKNLLKDFSLSNLSNDSHETDLPNHMLAQNKILSLKVSVLILD